MSRSPQGHQPDTPMRAKRATQVIAEGFEKAGIRRIYTVPGDLTYGLLQAFDAAGIAVLSLHSQASAVFASAADTLSTGQISSAVLVTRGPALANALAALSSTIAHGTPVVLMAPCESEADARSGAFQGALPLALDDGLACDTRWIEDAQTLAERVCDMLAGATGPRQCSAVMLLTRGLLQSRAVGRVSDESPDPQGDCDPTDLLGLQGAAEVLNRARAPVIVVGHRARWSVREEMLAALADRLNAPLCPTGLSIGFGSAALPGLDHDAVHRALAGADAILLVGAALDWSLRLGVAFTDEARVVALRHPDDNAGQGRRPEITLRGDIGGLLEALLPMIAPQDAPPRALPASPAPARPPQGLFNRVIADLQSGFPTNTALVMDGSNALIHAARHIMPDAAWARITPGVTGHLGAGIGHALGAAASGRFDRVILLAGDFSLGLALGDLESLLRYELPVTLLVDNNGGIATAQRPLRGPDRRILAYTPASDHARIMSGYGGRGLRVESHAEWLAVRAQALAGAGPCLVDVTESELTSR